MRSGEEIALNAISRIVDMTDWVGHVCERSCDSLCGWLPDVLGLAADEIKFIWVRFAYPRGSKGSWSTPKVDHRW